MGSLDVVHGWNQVRKHLPEEYASLAHEHAQVETKFGNAKIRDADTLLRFILLHVGANLALRQTVVLMAEAGLPSISPMRLHKKMAKAAPYLQALVSRMVEWPVSGRAERWGGYVFTAVDATVVCGPGAVGTEARVHTKLRVADVSIDSVEVTDERGGESFRRFSWSPLELAVGDRAYCSTKGVAHVVDAGAAVLVRYRLGALPLLDDEWRELDVNAAVRSLEDGAALDLDVLVPDGRRTITGRLIATRLDATKAEAARNRLRKDKGAELSQRSMELAGYVVLFTTASRSRLTADQCLRGYRLRWQIELQFKRWKSLCRFDLMPNQRPDTQLAWLYAKVLLGVLLDRMASIPAEISPPQHHVHERSDATHVERPVEAHEHPLPARRGGDAPPRAPRRPGQAARDRSPTP